MKGYDSPRASQEALKKDRKAVKILPWQCQSSETNYASSVYWSPVDGESSMETYPGEGSNKEQPNTQTTEATDGPSMGQRGVDAWPSMQASVTSMHAV